MDAAHATHAIDEVLATTRAVRKRLDLTRPVPDEVLWACIDLAEQAPSGGGLASRRWLVVRDPALKLAVAERYRAAGGAMLSRAAARAERSSGSAGAILSSAAFLADNLERVPALVLLCIWGEHDGSGNPGLFDSVIQAGWSFCLALRARGLGTSWTTMHLREREAVASLLAIPPGITQVVLFPVGYTLGEGFKRARRAPAAEITYTDRWGHTNGVPVADGPHLLAHRPGVTVEADIAAPAAVVWRIVRDADLPAHTDLPAGGDPPFDRTVLLVDEPGRRLVWVDGDPEEPSVVWTLTVHPLGMPSDRCRVHHHARLAAGPSALTSAVAAEPGREGDLVDRARTRLRTVLQGTVDALRAEAESAQQAVPAGEDV